MMISLCRFSAFLNLKKLISKKKLVTGVKLINKLTVDKTCRNDECKNAEVIYESTKLCDE